MAMRDIIPAVNAYVTEIADTAGAKKAILPDIDISVETDLMTKLSQLNAKAYAAVEKLKKEESRAAKITDAVKRAEAYCDKVIPAMNALRSYVDAMEPLTATEYWPLPTYGEMMFNV